MENLRGIGLQFRRLNLPARWVYLLAALAAFGHATLALAGPAVRDFREHVSRADLVYDTPITRSEAGMPIGNGTTGTLVWTTPDALHMQINRVDVFGNDRTTRSFNRNEDYCSGCGFVDIELAAAGDPVFTEEHYRQHVHVYDGKMTVRGRHVSATIVAHPSLDVIAVHIDDRRSDPEPIRIDLRKLRYSNKQHIGRNFELAKEHSSLVRTRSHLAKSTLALRDEAILLTQHFTERKYECSSAVAIKVIGRGARARITNPSTITLTAKPGGGPVTVLIASSAGFSAPAPVNAKAMETLQKAAAIPFAQLVEQSAAWWHDFWPKSYIRLRSDDGKAELVERHFTWWLYLMGSASRGTMPMKYNGMLWNTTGDLRMWGTQQWWHNLSMYYRALPAANHAELMRPMFDMYHGMYDSAVLSARQQWGSKGIFIGETSFFNGHEPLPDDIAAEMRELYLFRKPWSQVSDRFLEFAETQHPQNSRWNWKGVGHWIDGRWEYPTKTDPPHGHVVHLFGSMGQLAQQFWVYYQHTGDHAFLEEQAYPMLRGVAEFFRHYPNLRKGADGKLHIHGVNHMEGLRGATDSMGSMATMHAILPRAIRAAEILETDAGLRAAWRQMLADLAPLPHSGLENALSRSKPGEPVYWVNGCKPVAVGDGGPSVYPVAYFDLCTLETAERDPAMFERAMNTYRRRFRRGVAEDGQVPVLGRHAITAARLGQADDLRKFVYNQITNPYNDYCDWEGGGPPLVFPNRMTLREGPGSMEAQRLGNSAYGLSEALVQSVPAAPGETTVIHLFPAWPKQWDASFKLHCRGGFLISSGKTDGTITHVQIESERGATCRMRNPWGTREVSILRNGNTWKKLSGTMLVIETKAGELYELKPDRLDYEGPAK